MEHWDLYTFDGQKTGETMTYGQRQPQDRYRLVVHACIFDKAGRMLIQRRLPHIKGWPGLWDFTAGGSAIAGETCQQAAQRELLEETGLDISFAGVRPAMSLTFERGTDYIFTLEREVDLEKVRPQPEEVAEVKWASLEEVLAMVEADTFIPYHKGLIELLFALRNTRSSHTHPDYSRIKKA